ncbi:MAG: hypothetical protein ACKV2T_38125 [Kofleriaceae bacterium]
MTRRLTGAHLVLLSLAACAGSPRVQQPPPPPASPIQYVFEVGVSDETLGLVPLDACKGTVSGTLTVQSPRGDEQTIPVDPQEVTEHVRTYALGPGPGDASDRPRAWIALRRHLWEESGLYRVSGDGLRLSCGALEVRPARIFVAHRGQPFLLRDGDPEPKIAVAPPPAPAVTRVADIAKRMQMTHFAHRGTIEVLALPQTGTKTQRTTAWGALRNAPKSPTAVLGHQFGPAWLVERAAGTSREVVLDKPRIVRISLVDGVHTGDDPEAIRAGQSSGLLAATWRPIDGTPPVMLDVHAVLDDAAARWRQHVDAVRSAIEVKLSAALDDKIAADRAKFTKPVMAEELWFTPTWDATQVRLVSRYVLTVQRSARERRGKLQQDCPFNRPPSACRNVEVKRGWTATARIAIEVIYDRAGKLVEATHVGPELEVHEAP